MEKFRVKYSINNERLQRTPHHRQRRLWRGKPLIIELVFTANNIAYVVLVLADNARR